MGMTIDEICSKVDIELVTTTTSRYAWPLVEVWGYQPVSMFFTQNVPLQRKDRFKSWKENK